MGRHVVQLSFAKGAQQRQRRQAAALEAQAEALKVLANQVQAMAVGLHRIADALEDDPTTLARQARGDDICDSYGCGHPAMPGARLCAEHMGGDKRDQVQP